MEEKEGWGITEKGNGDDKKGRYPAIIPGSYVAGLRNFKARRVLYIMEKNLKEIEQ